MLYMNPTLLNPYGYNISTVPIHRQPIIFIVDSQSAVDKTDYTYEFPCGTIRNVIGIELVKAVVPNVDNDHYLIVKIDGMDNTLGINNVNQGAFCTLERDGGSSNPVVYVKQTDHRNVPYTYCMPEPRKLGNMRIRFFRPNGNPPDLTGNYLLVFEIHSLGQPEMPQW
jgi:hypothetical protein